VFYRNGDRKTAKLKLTERPPELSGTD
jgi:hypothetical protein